MPPHRTPLAVLVLLAGLSAVPASARDLKVAVTIKPIHALTAAIMEGAGSPTLIVDGQASPHTFALKPSAAREIFAADIFIRVGPGIEPWANRLIESIRVPVITLVETPGLTLLDRRTGASFEPHEHGTEEAHHDEPGDDHDHDSKDHDGKDHDGKDHDSKDGHIWLDPHNAAIIADTIADFLGGKDPEHAALYQANATRLKARLTALDAEIAGEMSPLKGRPFIVFHDATQYFEARYGLQALGSVTVSPDVQPSAKRLSELRAKISAANAACVFAEPYLNPRLIEVVTEGSASRAGTLDPEALALAPGPDLYFTLMRAMAKSFTTCLSP